MDEVKMYFLDLWGFLVSLWQTLRQFHKGFSLLLGLFCLLMFGLLFGFWAFVIVVTLLMIALFLKDLIPNVTDRQSTAVKILVLTAVLGFSLYAIVMLLGWIPAIIVLLSLIYFGFFVK